MLLSAAFELLAVLSGSEGGAGCCCAGFSATALLGFTWITAGGGFKAIPPFWSEVIGNSCTRMVSGVKLRWDGLVAATDDPVLKSSGAAAGAGEFPFSGSMGAWTTGAEIGAGSGGAAGWFIVCPEFDPCCIGCNFCQAK
jgi:hypothetical protein